MILHSLTRAFHSGVPLLLLAASLASSACMADLDDPAAPAEPAAIVVGPTPEDSLAPFTVFHWNQSEGQKTLEPKASHVCVLTGVAGSFKGFGEWVRVSTNNTSWVLEGGSQQGALLATATCVPRSLFVAMRGTEKVVTKQQTVSASGCHPSDIPVAGGSAFTFLEGIQGNFAGLGEEAWVQQAPTLDSNNELFATGCQSVRAFARSMRVGDPVHQALFMNPQGVIGAMDTIPPAYAHSPANATTGSMVPLAPTFASLCALTEIGGQFDGVGEAVAIQSVTWFDGIPRWTLLAGSHSGAGTFAAARCYAMEQR